MIRIGIIGRGMAGRIFHAPLIRAVPEMHLDRVVGRADAAALLEDRDIDLVVIATPNETHAHLAESALRAGKHVVIDKPFVLEPDDGQRLIDLAAQQSRMLTVFQNRRWDGDYLTVGDLVASGRLGEIRLFEAHWDRFRPAVPTGWREVPGPGTGTLWNLAPHMIDQMLLLFGTPDAVQADIVAQRPDAVVDDYFSLTFHYGSMRATLAASNLVASARPRFAIHGSAGSFVKFGLDPQEERLAAGVSPLDMGFANESPENYGWLHQGDVRENLPSKTGVYLEFYRGMARAIRDGNAPPVDPRDSLVGVRLLQLARRSAELKVQVGAVLTDRLVTLTGLTNFNSLD